MAGFLKRGETVLICYPKNWGNGAEAFSHAVVNCQGVPVVWSEDGLWKSLLCQAFFSRCTVAVGDPLVLLGLSKLRSATGTPLYIRNAVLSKALHMDWLEDGIRTNLDCSIRGFLSDCTDVLHEEPLSALWQELSGWNSVLDCRVSRESGGLNLELVVFPGLRLPKLPSCARLTVRNWNSQEDHPFLMEKTLKGYVF